VSQASGVRVGCCGWPVGHEAYRKRFGIVEVDSTFYNLPRLATAARWRDEAPADFEFSVKAWQLITHPSSSPTYRKLTEDISEKSLARCGGFRDSPEVASAWERTLAVARALRARFILFQTPESFYPGANHLRDMYRFFKKAQRPAACLVWEPRGDGWKKPLLERVCKDLGLTHAVDPLAGEPAWGSVHYFRLHGRREGRRIVYRHEYSDQELSLVLRFCEGRPSYVYFNNVSMWTDSSRFLDLSRDPRVRHLRPA